MQLLPRTIGDFDGGHNGFARQKLILLKRHFHADNLGRAPAANRQQKRQQERQPQPNGFFHAALLARSPPVSNCEVIAGQKIRPLSAAEIAPPK